LHTSLAPPAAGAEADPTGVGEQVQHTFVFAVVLDPAARVAQVEEQQRVLPGVASADAVVEPPLVADQILQGRFVGAVDGVFAIDTRVATGAVVVDQQQVEAQMPVDDFMQLQQASRSSDWWKLCTNSCGP
jgi:hypothetical protein